MKKATTKAESRRRIERDAAMRKALDGGASIGDLVILTGLSREHVIRRLVATGVPAEAIDRAR